jgi:hypothetical protein
MRAPAATNRARGMTVRVLLADDGALMRAGLGVVLDDAGPD